MKPIILWSGICTSLILLSLFLHNIPDGVKGMALTVSLFVVTGLMLVKVCRGSR